MGNVIAAPKPTKIQSLKRLIRVLDRHRSTLSRRIGRVTRELSMTENKLKSTLSRKSAHEACNTNSHLFKDSSVQLAQEIMFKRSQAATLNDILAKINLMQKTVTSIYLALHKRQVLHHIKNGIERVDIAEIAKEMNEEAESTENSGLSDNVKMVFEINKSVDGTIHAMDNVNVIKDSGSEIPDADIGSILQEFEQKQEHEMKSAMETQERRINDIKNAMLKKTIQTSSMS